MAGDAIVITGLGMVSPIGGDVVSSCAAARAGLTQWTELDLQVTDEHTLEAVSLKGHEIPWLTLGFEGFARWLRLGDAALRDLVAYSGLTRADYAQTGFLLQLPGSFINDIHLKTSLLERLPENERARIQREIDAERTEARNSLTRRLIPELLALNNIRIEPQAQSYAFGGAAASCQLLLRAIEGLRSRTMDRCIIGGIDSWVDGEPLTQAFDLGLLRTPNRPIGRFPGEAGAFILLERIDAARSRGARIEGLLGPVAFTSDTSHRFSGQAPSGKALFKAIEACFPGGARQATDVELLIANLNGDEQRAREFGHCLVHLKEAELPSSTPRWHVPEHFGEIGAATSTVATCLAVRGFARGYARSRKALVALLDDEPSRGAFLLQAHS
ncbi:MULTISPECIES: hypothetical protein [Myxococcus]|uniref:hypothetical protein n=1 Tax=Myxococcus TaxID=32 RepID=UPI00142F2E54|nr:MULTISPECIES: hypothetical protein [Myxococcus]NOJ52702.1 hypothetical protein [Myxococcus xanthus]QPM79400.1 hypothetical protein I5Q59_35115 [Myxococcus xanthus]QVW68480.1 hypothetical protein JTM82_02645 [Myxococcus xanthus DZ2]UEO05407.1 hypothetical protein K1515_02335 [Myxococcus xanthus DZ2]UYI14368.1 hypothetical protein N3T43_35780 [Myxococcus xanthus]